MNIKDIRRPVGLDEACKYIEEVCSQSTIFRHGIKPDHLCLNIDSGQGRTNFIEYVVGMYKLNNVLPFSCGLDDYIEIVPDGSLQQLQEEFARIADGAIYANEFENVVSVDVSRIADHQGECQFGEFMKHCFHICSHACVVFFTSSLPSRNEEKLVRKLKEEIENIREIKLPGNTYTVEELCQIGIGFVLEHGVGIEDEQAFIEIERDMLNKVDENMRRVKYLLREARQLIEHAGFSNSPPLITKRVIEAVYLNTQKQEGA